MAVPLTVQIYQGEQLIDTKQFDRDLIKIGRLSSAHLRLDDQKISRIHAVIEVGASEDAVSIIDMGSSQGTLVNDAKISKAKLNNGDTILVGSSKLVVYIGDGAAAAAQPAAQAAAPAMPGQPVAGMPGQPMQPGQPAAGMPGQPMQPGQPAAGMAPGQPMQPGQAGPGAVPGQPAPMQAEATTPTGAPGAQPGAPILPRFDGDKVRTKNLSRISTARLSHAAIESKAHPALPPEDRMTSENMSLEMRVYWGQILLDIRHYILPPEITIGEAKKNVDVFITAEGLPSDNFPIIRTIDDKYVLSFIAGMEGEFDLGEGIKTLDSLRTSTKARTDGDAYLIDMTAETKGILHWAGMTFAFRFVSPPKVITASPWKQIDLNFVNIVAVSFCLHIAFVVMSYVYPFEAQSLTENLFNQPDRWGQLILQPPEASKATEDLLKKIKDKMKKKEEKKEEKKPEPKEKVVTKKVVKKTREERKKEVTKKFEKLFDNNDSGSILGGGGGGSLAGSLSNVIGTMGAGSATAGLAGLGIRGSGPMTGGGAGTSKGIGGIGLIGGGGKGAKYRVGMKRKKQVKISFSAGPTVTGGLTKRDIKKVIRKNRNQIRYCYELGLQSNKELEGRVKINWIISAQGTVITSSVAQSDLPVKTVENCIVQKIRRWKFPQPKGGGIVEVNYPFIFKTS